MHITKRNFRREIKEEGCGWIRPRKIKIDYPYKGSITWRCEKPTEGG